MNTIKRRQLLAALGLGSAGLALSQLRPSLANADENAELPFLLFVYFSGGYDQLLCLDPRDNTVFGADSAIDPAYATAVASHAELTTALAETGGSGIVQPGNVAYGLTMGRALDHHQDLSVVRGIDMGTLTHSVGMRHFLTGRFPAGLSPVGSSFPTVMVDQAGTGAAIPNLAVGVETYNSGLDPAASGLRLNNTADLANVLRALDETLTIPDATRAAIDSYVSKQRCHDQNLDADQLVGDFIASREKAAALASGDLFEYFNFEDPSNPAISELYDAFGVMPNNASQQLSGPVGEAMIAAQAITKEVSQAVSIQLATNLDHHDDTYEDHAGLLYDGFNALGDLISVLKSRSDANGTSYWDRTVMVVWSEFARTPKLNGRGGRDHHLASSCLVGGGSHIRGDQVVGATSDDTFGTVAIDPATGAPTEGGKTLTPADVHATVLEALGMNADHLSNQEPALLQTLLPA